MSIWKVRDMKEATRTSLTFRCNFWISEWRLAAYGGFFREKSTMVLEARSILYAVRYAASNYPLGRHLILSDNLALVASSLE